MRTWYQVFGLGCTIVLLLWGSLPTEGAENLTPPQVSQPAPSVVIPEPPLVAEELRGILSSLRQLSIAEQKIAKLEEITANCGEQGGALRDQISALKQMIEILNTVITAQAQALASDMLIIARYKQQLADEETYWKARRDDEVAHWKELYTAILQELKDERSKSTWNEVWGWIRTLLGIGVTAAILS
jgi:hypothetical protein